MIQMLPETSETILFSLRSLFEKHGYLQYRMNKFEEYDLYAKNKDFLISDRVITFNDGNGKLLALKPDVTLSIVKNTRDTDSLQKLYYNENVYRVAKGTRSFKEIMQVGLECIGNVDKYCIYEVLGMAKKSLDTVSTPNVLAVSNLSILADVMNNIGIADATKSEVLSLIGEKNIHELSKLLESIGIPAEKAEILKKLARLSGKTADVLRVLESEYSSVISKSVLSSFAGVMKALEADDGIMIDFSVVGDINYYNGFIFKGFVEGIPTGILSGGQYDMLMKKMGRKSNAVGFAVYIDMIEQFMRKTNQFDVDTVLIYDENSSLAEINTAVDLLSKGSKSVLTGTTVPSQIKYKRLVKLTKGKVETVEENA